MKEEDKLLEFIIFCVESTAARLGRCGSDVYRKMKETGALEHYVKLYYDALHTQGETYIVDSLLVVRTIDLYLRGDYTREEALARLVHQEPNNQICIINQEIINRHLHFIEKIRLVTGVAETPIPYADPALQAKYLGIVERLVSVLNISQEQALDVFYSSDTYRYLSQRRGDLHLMSAAYLADEIMIELQRKQGG